ncbi:MAG: hypothetical protein JW881_22050 [Spirochaetales bacterium]|nr:hypothetical protein [Spirochaetales bacterium]
MVDGNQFENAGKYSTKDKTIEVLAQKEGYLPVSGRFENKSIFAKKEIVIELEKKKYDVSIDATEDWIAYTIDGESSGVLPFNGFLTHGRHTLELTKEDGPVQSIGLDIKKEDRFLLRYQRQVPFVNQIGIFSCGGAPKQVTFSPDDRYLYITLLGGQGFQIFDMEKKAITCLVGPDQWARKLGFVEGIFIEKYHCYFVSQMGPAQIYEYDVKTDGTVAYKRTIKSGGSWSKVIAYSDRLDLLAVSNWCSNDVSIIEYETGKVIRKIDIPKAPRGLAFSLDARYLYIASFDGGFIFKYKTDDWSEDGRIYKRGAAMRHIVIAPDDRRIFVSNMYHCEVYEIDCESFEILHRYKVFHNPNTIDISGDARYLFVSCRGPNNEKRYTLRSPLDGKVMIFDTETKECVATIQGGNQPTGLDVSNNGKYCAFTNFQDANFELYDISALGQSRSDGNIVSDARAGK